MNLRLLSTTLLTVVSGWADAPSGRWDGMIGIGELKVPFTIHFEGSGAAFTGSFVNGDERVPSTSGSFEDGVVRLVFERLGTQLEATVSDVDGLNGSYGSAKYGMHPVTALAYCTCAYEGEAGPDIVGAWAVAGLGWRVTIQRKGDDTFATVSRGGSGLGPLTGRFDGLTFQLRYFDGVRAAVVEIEERKDGGLDLVWKEPGEEVKKLKAVRAGG